MLTGEIRSDMNEPSCWINRALESRIQQSNGEIRDMGGGEVSTIAEIEITTILGWNVQEAR